MLTEPDWSKCNCGAGPSGVHAQWCELAKDSPILNPGTDLVLPHSGELISLEDTAGCCRALGELRELEVRVRELKSMLTDAVVDESRRQGAKTLHLGNLTAEVKGGERVLWDAQQLEADLRASGMPENRIREIVIEEVSYTVSATEAKRAARANDGYATAVDGARTVIETRPSVSVKLS